MTSFYDSPADQKTGTRMSLRWGVGEYISKDFLVGTFTWKDVPETVVAPLVKFEFEMDDGLRAEVNEALIALLDPVGPTPPDWWGNLHASWLRTRDGVVVFIGEVDSSKGWRLRAVDYVSALPDRDPHLQGTDQLRWVTSQVGTLLEPQ